MTRRTIPVHDDEVSMALGRLGNILRWMHWLRPYDWQIPMICRLVPQMREVPMRDQRSVSREFDRKLMNQPLFIFGTLVANLLLLGGLMITGAGRFMWRAWQLGPAAFGLAFVGMIGILLAGFGFSRYVMVALVWPRQGLRILRRTVREIAAIRICERCGYDLRGTPGSVCPECGSPLEPDQREGNHAQ